MNNTITLVNILTDILKQNNIPIETLTKPDYIDEKYWEGLKYALSIL